MTSPDTLGKLLAELCVSHGPSHGKSSKGHWRGGASEVVSWHNVGGPGEKSSLREHVEAEAR